jgi:cobyrinic acid a,c-diamide synthase
VLGGMVAARTQQFPSRHLGLRAADEAVSDHDLDTWAARLAALTDLDGVLALARSAAPLRASASSATTTSMRCRIGVARDEAFSFYYEYNLRLLAKLGAELVPFSPLRDHKLPAVDGLYLGGGYPELHASALCANGAMRDAVRAFSRTRPVYAECGGLMYLSDAIVDLAGQRHDMVGAIDGVATMQPKLEALGYVEVATRAATVLGPAGVRFRGHQFRYSRFATEQPPQLYALRTRRSDAETVEGYGGGNVLASYVHAHWGSNPEVAAGFVRACAS